MARLILAVVVGAAVVAATVRLFIGPVSQVAGRVCTVVVPESISEAARFHVTLFLADALLATPGLLVAVLIARRRPILPGRCRVCGYNLVGNITGQCPQCGNTKNVR